MAELITEFVNVRRVFRYAAAGGLTCSVADCGSH